MASRFRADKRNWQRFVQAGMNSFRPSGICRRLPKMMEYGHNKKKDRDPCGSPVAKHTEIKSLCPQMQLFFNRWFSLE